MKKKIKLPAQSPEEGGGGLKHTPGLLVRRQCIVAKWANSHIQEPESSRRLFPGYYDSKRWPTSGTACSQSTYRYDGQVIVHKTLAI